MREIIYILSLAIALNSAAFGAAAPKILCGGDISVIGKSHKTRALPVDLLGEPLSSGDIVHSNNQRAYIFLSNNQIIELSPNTTLSIGEYLNNIQVVIGTATLHFRNPPDTSCFIIDADSARIRYVDADSVWVRTADSVVVMHRGESIVRGAYRTETGDDASSKDAEYLFKQIEKGRLPATEFRFRFPSDRPPAFRQKMRGKGGIATFEEERYYYTGWIYRLNFHELEFAYDFWFALSSEGRFYTEAWDEWSDLIDHIHHIQLFRPEDPFFLRAGLIENLTFGRGMLVNNYNNAVFLPFEKRNGIEARADFGRLEMRVFANDIGYPRIFGFYGGWEPNKRLKIDVAFAGDVDQLVDIKDSDGDSYPDETDPQPDIFNHPDDSVLVSQPSQSMNDISATSIYGMAFGMRYKFLRDRYFSGNIGGELAALNNIGIGITFPNIRLGYRWVDVGVGLDLQTPRFQNGIFDRTYESDKARFVEDESGNLRLVTRGGELSETEGWLYGWNNSFSVKIRGFGRCSAQFHDIYRDEMREKRFALGLNIEYPIFKYITKISFFIDQKNVAQLFQKRTDGENWGLGFEVVPHRTIRIRLRYRERYEDYDGDSEILGGEVKRNFDANAVIDGNYWWRKFLEWAGKPR